MNRIHREIENIDFQDITEYDRNIMGQCVYYEFYRNYCDHYLTDDDQYYLQNQFRIEDYFVKCFLASSIAKQIALANVPLTRPYAKLLTVTCESPEYYHEFVGNDGINYLLDVLRILDNVNHLKIRGGSHRNAALFLPLMKRPSSTKNIETLDIHFGDKFSSGRHPVHSEYVAGKQFFQESLKNILDSVQNLVISGNNGFSTEQLLEVFEANDEETVALPLESLKILIEDDSFLEGGNRIGSAGFWVAINQPQLSNLRHLDIDVSTNDYTMMLVHQAMSNNQTITSINIRHNGFDDKYIRIISIWVHRLLDLFLLETNRVHSLTIEVLSQQTDLFFDKIIRFARLSKSRKIKLKCHYRDDSGNRWRGLNQAMGTKLLEAVTENHRLEKVGIKVLNRETKENIEM